MTKWKRFGKTNYSFSSDGKCRNDKTGRIRKTNIQRSTGYERLTLPYNNKIIHVYVHQGVASCFLGKPRKGYEVNHKDLVKTNNNLSNLEYVTSKQNKAHARANGVVFGRKKK